MNDEALFHAGELETLKNRHREWIESYSANRGNDGPKVVEAVFDHLAEHGLPPGRSFLSWMQELCVTLGYQFNRDFPNCAKTVNDATTELESIFYSTTIPADERQRAILDIYRQGRQWLAFTADLDETDRLINRLIDRQEFGWEKGITLEELKAFYGPEAFDYSDDTLSEEFDLESIEWDRVAKCAYDFAQSGIVWDKLAA